MRTLSASSWRRKSAGLWWISRTRSARTSPMSLSAVRRSFGLIRSVLPIPPRITASPSSLFSVSRDHLPLKSGLPCAREMAATKTDDARNRTIGTSETSHSIAGISLHSPCHYVAVPRWTHAAHEDAASRMDEDPLYRADSSHVADVELVAEKRKLLEDMARKGRRYSKRYLDRAGKVRSAEAGADDRGRFERLLHVHPELDDVEEELELGLGLGVGPGRAEHEIGLLVLQCERGVDRVARSLARRKHVRVTVVEEKIRHPVVEKVAGAFDHHAAPESREKARGDGDHVPLAIDHREVRREPVGIFGGGADLERQRATRRGRVHLGSVLRRKRLG